MITDHRAGTLSALDRAVVDAVPPGGNWKDLPDDFPSKRIEQIRAGAASGGGSRSTYYGRLTWDRPSYTISTFFSRPGNGCFIHPSAPRLITLREGARLQSFPDSYRFVGSTRARYVQVGNAVPPLLAYALAQALPADGAVVDLFAGAGGMSLGLELAGLPLVAAVDNNAIAMDTFNENRPRTERGLCFDLGDPAEHHVAMKEIRARAGQDKVQTLVGGPPCQGFSTAGNCQVDDTRNRLVFSFLQAVEALRPQTVLMENVAALLFKRRKPVLDEICRQLRAGGYETSVIVAHAEAYAVPQLRRRAIILAHRGAPVAWPAPLREVLAPAQWDAQPLSRSTQGLPFPVTVREAIGDLPATEAPTLDSPVLSSTAASSAFQSWARGDLPTADFVGPMELVPQPHALA